MHKDLRGFLKTLVSENKDLKFPEFCSKYSKEIDKKSILVILQDPGNSSPENKTGECSIENPDQTALKLKEIITSEMIDPEEVILWNFFPFFGYKEKKSCLSEDDIDYWAKKIDTLISLLPNLKVIIVSGNDAWLGMRHFRSEKKVQITFSPHPSILGQNSSKNAPKRMVDAWKNAKKHSM